MEITLEFLNKSEEVCIQEKSIFLRWDLPYLKDTFYLTALQVSGFRFHKTRSVQPQHTLVVDLTQSEEELLRGMHEKTRYNIRLATRHGVTVRAANPQDIDAFLALLAETAQRDKILLHSSEHYEKLLEALAENSRKPHEPFVRLYIASHQGQILAGALVLFYAGTATYLHGASSSSHRNIMTPYLLHWHTMCEAKRMGYAAYDFWGVDDTNPRWTGITRFKRGFGGNELHFPSSVDVVLRVPWYGLYRVLTCLR